MRTTPPWFRRAFFYLNGNQRLCHSEQVHSLDEAITILERNLTANSSHLKITRGGALEASPIEIDRLKLPIESIKKYLNEKVARNDNSFTDCRYEVYFNPFRNGTKTHYLEIIHGINPEKETDQKIPYEGLFIEFKTKR